MTPQRKRLLDARKRYSECAKLIESRIKATGLSTVLSEQVIGTGVAVDWLRRAAEMDDISFMGSQLHNSEHKTSFVELLRFTFTWFGLNAIFSRPSLLRLIGSSATPGEFGDFLVLFDATSLPNGASQLAELHDILSKSTSPRMPGRKAGDQVTTLLAIQTKYLQHAAKKGSTAKQIDDAAQSGNIASLKLPTLVYAFRNWSVHGAALDGSFGTRPGFARYVGILQDVMAEVHHNTAGNLLTKI